MATFADQAMKTDPILQEFGLTAELIGECPIPVVHFKAINQLCARMGHQFEAHFDAIAMGQTASMDGMYHYDVADILRTIQTGIPKEDWD